VQLIGVMKPENCCHGVQALSAAEQGEKDPLGRTSSTISLQLIMQSEAAGMFNSPLSGVEGHAMLAATVAKMQTEHEASQEAAIQQHAHAQEAADADGSVFSQDQSENDSFMEAPRQPQSPLQKPQSHSWDESRAGLGGDSPHDAPVQLTGMHSGELTMSATPILGSSDDLKRRNG